jgi:hypothetical protein
VPWDYPIPPGFNSTHNLTTCTSFEGDGYNNNLKIFKEAMTEGKNSQECHCLPNCAETTYEYTVDTTDLHTDELCGEKKTKKVSCPFYLALVSK